jgi:hypothetical protein
MAEDHGRHLSPLDVGVDQLERRSGHLGGDERIEHDLSGIAPHEADVRQVEATDLIDPVHHLEQPAGTVEPLLPP